MAQRDNLIATYQSNPTLQSRYTQQQYLDMFGFGQSTTPPPTKPAPTPTPIKKLQIQDTPKPTTTKTITKKKKATPTTKAPTSNVAGSLGSVSGGSVRL